jgi:predicted nucleic acid-binding protein
MGTQYLLDTNSVIDFGSKKLPSQAHKKIALIIDSLPKISVIDKIELLSLSNVSREIVHFSNVVITIPLMENVVSKTIDLRKNHKIKVPDAIIAATALLFDLTLVTHNISDFKGIKGLKLVDSYLIGSKSI